MSEPNEHQQRLETLDQAQLDEVYNNAEAAIYAIAEQGETEGLTDRILAPVYSAVMEASGYQPGLLEGETQVVQMASAVMKRLQDNQELLPDDEISQVPVNGAGWDIVRYNDSEGNSFVIDPFNDYVGPEKGSPTKYDQVTLLQRFVLDREVVRPSRVESGSAEKAEKGQDRIINDPEKRTFAVFDGMGGHAAGEVASEIARDVVIAAELHTIDEPESVLREISKALRLAGDKIQSQQKDNPELRGMGTTAVVGQVIEQGGKNQLVWGLVGDSRLYVSDEDGFRQLGKDDGIFDDDGKPIPGRGHVLTNYVGRVDSGSINEHNKGILELKPGARVMLCSDGITGDEVFNELSEATMSEIIRVSESPQAAADELLRVSKKEDDKSVVVFELTS